MGLTKSEQWTLCFVMGLVLVGFLIQSHRERTTGRAVWVEPADGWQPLVGQAELTVSSQSSDLTVHKVSGNQTSPALLAPPAPQSGQEPEGPTPSGARIELNSAGRAELELLPGIGPAKAEAILRHRAEIKAFNSVDQLQDVKGIGPATLAKIRPFLTIGPASGAAEDPNWGTGPLKDSQRLDNTRLADNIRSKIDLNSASPEQLQSLPGIGPVLAERIVQTRSRRPFEAVEDLDSVKGIGPVTLERIRPLVTVR